MTSETSLPEVTGTPKHWADAFRQGLAPQPVRLQAAQGELPAPLAEKLEILVLLTADPEEEIRRKALLTLQNWNTEELCQALSDALMPSSVLEFAAHNLAAGCEGTVEALLQNPSLSPRLQNLILARLATSPLPAAASHEASAGAAIRGGDEEAGLPERETTRQKLNRMSATEKIKCALTGSQEERLILVRDANKMVARAVLQSPKLSEVEVEAYASMKDTSEEVLRLIFMNRSLMKTYSVQRALVNNPRSPLGVTLPLVNRLNDRDLKSLSTNRNVPDALRATAAKTLSAHQNAHTSSFSRKH